MRMKWRINCLALLGAIIGVVSIFFPWGAGGNGHVTFYYNLIETGSWQPVAAIVFILGTGLSFITSLGVIIQSISFFGSWPTPFTSGGILPWEYGPVLALISIGLLVLSMFLLITIPHLEKPYSLRMRLLTFTKIDEPNLPVQTNDRPNAENAP